MVQEMALIGRFLLLKTTAMNTIIRISVLFTVLSVLSQNSAQAGFYDWLVDENASDRTFIPVNSTETSASFEKLFSWDNGQTVSAKSDKITLAEPTPKIKIVKTHTVRATGYSSTPDQTDSTPFTTASGTRVRDGIIAANIYFNGRRIPFGTLVRIPEIYGDKIFVVEDRMNIRYKNNIDIWFPERSLARTFGSKKVTIEIVEES